jgi:hypothetical protein
MQVVTALCSTRQPLYTVSRALGHLQKQLVAQFTMTQLTTRLCMSLQLREPSPLLQTSLVSIWWWLAVVVLMLVVQVQVVTVHL